MPQLHLLEAFYMPLPYSSEDFNATSLSSKEKKEVRVVAAQVYLLHFISRLRKTVGNKIKSEPLIKQPDEFMKRLYLTRFSGIYPEYSLFIQRSTFACFSTENDIEKYKKIVKKITAGDKEKAVKDAAGYAAACVNEDSIETAVKIEWVQDYIEQIARWAMGSPDDAVFFIRECLNFDTLLSTTESPVEVQGPSSIKIESDKV